MPAIKQFLRGRDVTQLDIVPQDQSAAGVLSTTATSADALASLLGRFKSLTIRNRVNSEIIMSVDDIIENNVPITTGYTFEMTEILTKKTGTGGMATSSTNYEPVLPYLFNKLTSGVSTYDYFKVTFLAGGKTTVLYGLKQELSYGKTAQGEETATMSFLPVNGNFDASGTASIAYS
jgi:hypothetical protein